MAPVSARKDMESWENVVEGTVYLKRLDHRGEMTRDEDVRSGRVIHLTPEERRINSEMAATHDLDPFKNGMLRPVRLLDDSDEAKELASNPNVMSESDMATLLKVHHKTFQARLSEIRNPYALQRLLKVATVPESDVSHSKVEAIKGALREVSPQLAIEVEQMPVSAGASTGMRAVTPR